MSADSQTFNLLYFPHQPVIPGSTLPPSVYVARLAWPVYAWRVVAPRLNFEVDPLQLAVLRLMRAGVNKSDEIARLLNMNKVLIDEVKIVSYQDNLLDDRGLTETGLAVIENRELAELDGEMLEQGWIFRDALGGDVIPIFFSDSLPRARRYEGKDLITLPFQELFQGRPSPRSINSALLLYSRLLRLKRPDTELSALADDRCEPDMEMDWEEIDEQPCKQVADAPGKQSALPGKLTLISNRPESASILTQLYIQANDPATWRVRSPFGLAGGWWFRSRLQWACQQFPEIGAKLKAITANAQQHFLHNETEVTAEDEGLLSALTRHENLHDCLNQLHSAYKAENIFNSYTSDSTFNSVVVEYQSVLEALFYACNSSLSNLQQVATWLSHGNNRDKVVQAAEHFGLELPKKMKGIELNPKAVLKKMGGNALRDRVLFLLLYAFYHQDSWPATLLRNEPGLLAKVDLVADYRNISAHYSPEKRSVDQADVIREVKQAVQFVLVACLKHLYGDDFVG